MPPALWKVDGYGSLLKGDVGCAFPLVTEIAAGPYLGGVSFCRDLRCSMRMLHIDPNLDLHCGTKLFIFAYFAVMCLEEKAIVTCIV